MKNKHKFPQQENTSTRLMFHGLSCYYQLQSTHKDLENISTKVSYTKKPYT